MANCPKCGRHLNFWDVKAECPGCGVNIPNYNWEERLDADAIRAEHAWHSFRVKTGNMKSALFGSFFRKIRFICTFLPLIALVLPLINSTVLIPFISETEKGLSLLSFTMNHLTTLNIPSLMSLIKIPAIGSFTAELAIGTLLLYLAIVFGVLNFVFVLIDSFKMKARKCIVLSGLATACFASSAILFAISLSGLSSTSVNFFGGTLAYGLFVGIGLFALNTIINSVTHRSFKKESAKSSDEAASGQTTEENKTPQTV